MTAAPRILVCLAAVVAVAVMAAPASAQYPPSSEELAVTDTAPAPGQEILVTGGGFMPGTTVTLTFESTPVFLAEAPVDDEGRFAVLVRIPPDATTGWHTIRARGTGLDGLPRELAIPIFVAAPARPDGPSSAGGATWIPLLRVGVGPTVVVLVAATLWTIRRRRKGRAPAA